MSLTYLDQEYVGFKEYVRSAKVRVAASDSTPVYAHPIDGWILKTLNSVPVKAVLSKAIDSIVSFQFGAQLASAVYIDQKSFPELYEVLAHCSRTLGIPIPHASTDNSSLFNAATAGTDDYSLITISATLCEFFPREEACFVIGHECGHIAAGHMLYHTIVRMLTEASASSLFGPMAGIVQATAGLPLMAWSRRSEITADRAGLLCCGDAEVAERALLRLVLGFAKLERVDIESYLRRAQRVEDFHKLGMLQEYMHSHPLIPKRIRALRLFAQSELYYSLTGKPQPEGVRLLGREELDRRVNQIVTP